MGRDDNAVALFHDESAIMNKKRRSKTMRFPAAVDRDDNAVALFHDKSVNIKERRTDSPAHWILFVFQTTVPTTKPSLY